MNIPDLILECAIPCINQTYRWKEEQKLEYEYILKNADIITYVSKSYYFNGCMAKRNKYIVDKSSRLIAVFSGAEGETKQTIDMAKTKNLDIVIINI